MERGDVSLIFQPCGAIRIEILGSSLVRIWQAGTQCCTLGWGLELWGKVIKYGLVCARIAPAASAPIQFNVVFEDQCALYANLDLSPSS